MKDGNSTAPSQTSKADDTGPAMGLPELVGLGITASGRS